MYLFLINIFNCLVKYWIWVQRCISPEDEVERGQVNRKSELPNFAEQWALSSSSMANSMWGFFFYKIKLIPTQIALIFIFFSSFAQLLRLPSFFISSCVMCGSLLWRTDEASEMEVDSQLYPDSSRYSRPATNQEIGGVSTGQGVNCWSWLWVLGQRNSYVFPLPPLTWEAGDSVVSYSVQEEVRGLESGSQRVISFFCYLIAVWPHVNFLISFILNFLGSNT